MPIEIGDMLGDYQVTGFLGRGRMGKVFRVRNVITCSITQGLPLEYFRNCRPGDDVL